MTSTVQNQKLTTLFFYAALLHFFCFATLSPIFAEDTPYSLAPGDTLEIHVVGRDELTTKQVITPDGTLSIPVMGRLVVSGKTLFELDALLEGGFAKVVKSPHVVTYLTPKPSSVSDEKVPIYVVLCDLKKETWEVKVAKTSQEALAWTAGRAFKINGKAALSNIVLNPGDTVQVDIGSKTDFWESNWYKVLTGAAVVTGIVKSFVH